MLGGKEAVDVALLVGHTVTVVAVEDGGQGDLLVQGPGAVIHVLVEVGLACVVEDLLIEHRGVGEAVDGQEHGACDDVLELLIVGGIVETLGPPGLVEVQVLGVAQVGEGAVYGLAQGDVAGGAQYVVLVCACLNGGVNPIDDGIAVHIVLKHVGDLDVQPLLNSLVALVDGVIDGLAVDVLDPDLTVGPAVAVAADEGDLLAFEVQVVGQIVAELGLALLDGSGGLGCGLGVLGAVISLGAGGQGACQQESCQDGGEDAFGVHGMPPNFICFLSDHDHAG